MAANKPMDIVKACENTLGWTPPLVEKGMALHKARAIEAKRLQGAMDKDPTVTFRALELAIELARRRKQTRGPLSLIPLIPAALARASEEKAPMGLAAEIAEAIAKEQRNELPDANYWIGRLTRSQGPFRAKALADWRQARQET